MVIEIIAYTITIAAFVFVAKDIYKRYTWNRTWWKCEGCNKACYAPMTFGNILEERTNWVCYHEGCKKRNYNHIVTKKDI